MKSERSPWSTFRRFGTLFVVNVVIVFFLVLGFGREYLRNLEIERNIRQLEEENTALEGQKLESLSVIASLSSEYYLEGEARKKHGLAKPGEQLVIVEDGGGATDQDGGATTEDGGGGSNVAHWFSYFFDHSRFEDLRSL